MFSQEPHCIYEKNQLGEVICQLRFPVLPELTRETVGKFHGLIRSAFPTYTARKEPVLPKPGIPPQTDINHQFSGDDGIWRINITSRFFSLATKKYTTWEDFALRMDQSLAAFLQVCRPAYFERIGLRYLNFISRRDLALEGTPFCDLIAPAYLGILADPEIIEITAARTTVDADFSIRGGCRAKIHAGPGMVRHGTQQDKEPKFILDIDLYMPGKLELNYAPGALQTLHSQAFPIFRDAITDSLHRAMKPNTP